MDSELGGLTLSFSGRMVAYVAERKLPKNEPYFKTMNGSQGGGEKYAKAETRGREYDYRPDLGEQLVSKKDPVAIVVDLSEHNFEVMDEKRLFGCDEKGWSPGQLAFVGEDKLVGIGIRMNDPWPLGLIYCSNRPSSLFLSGRLSKKDSSGFLVSGADKKTSARCPRVSKNGSTLIWSVVIYIFLAIFTN